MAKQRRFERVAFFCPLQLTVLPNGPTVPANSFDISAGGVGVTAAVFLERGKDVRVDFHVKNGSHEECVESVLGRIAYSWADEDGNRIGIEFLETIRKSAQPGLMEKLDVL